jgi:hypothetical protein
MSAPAGGKYRHPTLPASAVIARVEFRGFHGHGTLVLGWLNLLPVP